MSNFPFISDNVLQSNLDLAFAHITDLVVLSESHQYKGDEKKPLAGSIRKTIVIHIASIIEALLLWKLKVKCRKNNIELVDEWRYLDVKILHKISESEEVVCGKRKREMKNIDKLDFLRITDLCIKYKIIGSLSLRQDIDKVRELRNRLHLGGLSEIEKEYHKSDLEFCFGVARRVTNTIS